MAGLVGYSNMVCAVPFGDEVCSAWIVPRVVKDDHGRDVVWCVGRAYVNGGAVIAHSHPWPPVTPEPLAR